jgi:hypothetical protein
MAGVFSTAKQDKVVLYHSRVDADHPIHHNNPVCRIGGQTSIRDIRLGDDGRPLCDLCAVLRAAAETT